MVLRKVVFVITSLLLSACQETRWFADKIFAPEAKWESEEWTILAHRIPDELDKKPSMFWLRAEDGTAHALRPELAGFKPRWGVEYRIEVSARETSTGMYGAVSGWLSFERVIAETPRAGEEFTVEGVAAAWLDDQRRAFVDGQAFSCVDEGVCERLEKLAAEPERRFDMQMRHGAEPGLLALMDVTPKNHSED